MAGKDYKSPIIQGNAWAAKDEYGGKNQDGEEIPIEEVIAQLRSDLYTVQINLNTQVNLLKEEIRTVRESIENIHNGIQSVNESLSKQTKASTYLERRVDGVRTDTSTGIALSIVVFSILFIVSLFIR